MLRRLLPLVFAAILLLPNLVAADPIKLKLSFFTSDRSSIYQCELKPFVTAVNAEGKGLVEVVVYFSGAISPVQAKQPQLILDGAADMAIVVPSYSPKLFADSAVMELPGLFRDASEGSHIFGRLIESGGLKGYGDFLALSAVVSAGESIHSRKPIARLADLRGQRIRVNNQIEADTLRQFGAIPNELAVNGTMDSLAAGKVDGATVPAGLLFEFGFGRLTANHYMIRLGGVPHALLMSRAKFNKLPPQVQDILRKNSGAWLSRRTVACFADKNRQVLAQLEKDPRRHVVFPSAADLADSKRVFDRVTEHWASASPHNRQLLDRVKSEIARLRATE